MLDTIRKNATSWGVKIIFGVIALVFVFWGIGSFRARNRGILAKVNDTYIRVKDFAEIYQKELDAFRRTWKDVSESTLNKLGFKKRIFDRMVNDILLENLCYKLGIVVPASSIEENIKNTKFFWNKENKFDFNRYKEVLAYAGMTPAVYESRIEKEFIKQKLLEFIYMAAYVSESQAKDVFDFMYQRLKMKYIDFMFKDFENRVKISNDEIKKYYKAHRKNFVEKAKIKLRYLLITPEELSKVQNVTLEEMKKYYEDHKSDFKTRPMIKLRYIYIKSTKDMKEEERKKKEKKLYKVLKLLKQGRSFSEIAKKYSEDVNAKEGGLLGWIEEDSLFPEIKRAIESIKINEISKPVKTERGFFIVKLEDKKRARLKSFEEVKDEIREIIAKEKAVEEVDSSLDKALEVILNTKDPDIAIKKAGEAIGLEVKESGFFTQDQGPEGILLKREDLKSLFTLSKGKILDTPIMLKNGYMIAQKIDEKPERIRKLKEVEDDILSILKKVKARQLARKEAEMTLDLLKQGKTNKIKYKIKESKFFTRSGYIPDVGYNIELVKKLFSSPLNRWLDQVFELQDRYIIALPLQKVPPEEGLWQKQKERWIFMLSQRNKNILLVSFLNNLRKKAKIKIIAPELLK